VIITKSVTPPDEPCEGHVVETTGTFSPPSEVIDCPDPYCGRLISPLRTAAKEKDAREILARAAVARYRGKHSKLASPEPSSLVIQNALSDLAVTGRSAYASFRALSPVEADLTARVTSKLAAAYPTHKVVKADLRDAIKKTLERAYKVAWALRGPVSHRSAKRNALGWIAVTAEDDPPDRPVNVGSALFPQYDLTVQVGGPTVVTPVTTRFMVASRQFEDEYPVKLKEVPPQRAIPPISGEIVLFIHGHSSLAEEVMPLVGPLLLQAEHRGRQMTVISLDLPSNGYASMIEHTKIAKIEDSLWNTGYPILDFIEDFIVAFVDELETLQPGFKEKIVGVIGGSLGGNMGLRLAGRDPARHPWLHSVVSWSPASTWLSWARAQIIPIPEKGRFYDVVKHEGVGRTRGASVEDEVETPFNKSSLNKFFYEEFAGQKIGRIAQSDHWYSKDWPCREAAKESSHRGIYEIYNKAFRHWHWRVAHEQLIYSHWDSDTTDPHIDPDPRNDSAAGPARYTQIKSRMLLATALDDDEMPEKIFSNTQVLANAMTMVEGTTLFVEHTGHSIPTERPVFFASQILDFLYRTPPAEVGPLRLFGESANDGTVAFDQIRSDLQNTNAVWRGKWTPGWTSFQIFPMGGKNYMFAYKVGDGTVAFDEIRSDLHDTNAVWRPAAKWTPGWTSFQIFPMGGKNYMFAYKAGDGTVAFDEIRSDLQNTNAVWRPAGKWTPGWTSFQIFPMGGKNYMFAYKAGDGTVAFDEIRSDLQNTNAVWRGKWTPGWTSFQIFPMGGKNYMFAYKAGDGTVAFDEIRSDLHDTNAVWRGKWTPGWTSFQIFPVT
jgi:pimeloyl-ACP methyl ester carboxylesterase